MDGHTIHTSRLHTHTCVDRAAGIMLFHLLSGSFPFWAGDTDAFHGMSAEE
jgi:hypothetical protein